MMYISSINPIAMKYFVYRHVRLDCNEVFYIGCGKIPKPSKIFGYRTYFSRAFSNTKRNKFWLDVYSKTKIRVDIMYQTESESIAFLKEAEMIKLYGRKLDGTGTLVNISASRGAPKRKYNVSINQLDLNGNLIKKWEELDEIQSQLGFLKTNIVKVCRKKQITAYGYKWEYASNRKFDKIYPTTSRAKSKNINKQGIILVNNITKERLIFRTQDAVANYLNISRSTVHKWLHSMSKNKDYDIFYRVKLQNN